MIVTERIHCLLHNDDVILSLNDKYMFYVEVFLVCNHILYKNLKKNLKIDHKLKSNFLNLKS